YNIGQSWFRAGRHDIALATFENLIEKFPESTIAPVTELMVAQVEFAIKNNKNPEMNINYSDENTIVDPETGITYSKVKTFTGKNDLISYTSGGFNMSPDGRFLVLENKVVPTDGSDPFTLVDMDALRAVYSPDMKNAAFYAESAIWIVPVSPETGRSIGQPIKLLEGSYVFQHSVNWSPDGKKIAFTRRDKTIAGDIWVISVSDGKLMPITNSPQDDYGPVWSPDGNKIAFVRGFEIWLASADGSETKMIIKQDRFTQRMIWKSDSKWLFYRNGGQNYLYSLDHNKHYNFNVPEHTGDFISFSTTGGKILFYRTSFNNKWGSKIVSASGGPTYSPIPNISVFDAQWSTNSKQIVVESENMQGETIYKIISLAGGNTVDVEIKANVNDKLLPFGFSHNLTSLAFLTAKENDKFDLYIIPFSMQEGQTIGPAKKVFENWSRGNLSWSPENTRLALVHERGIWIVPLDGGSPVQIANTPEGLRGVGWSPDGKMISYWVESKNTRIIYAVSATSGVPQVVHSNCKTGSWGPDSKSMALLANGEILIVSLSGEKLKHIVNLKDFGLIDTSSPKYSPDGKQLAFIGYNGDKSLIFMYSFDSGKIKRLAFENQDDEKYFLNWSPDGKWLSYLSEENIKVRLESFLWEANFKEVKEKLLQQQ
ncbi:MAG: PD40 domain-containing protein, partial [Mariniphaga sp.]|nr:PD40 domain-containing protein [Mariniphaga sp.]